MKTEHPLPGDVPALRQLWQQTFGDSHAFLDIFFSAAYAADRCLCLKIHGGIAAAAYWLDCELHGQKAAYIYAVATAPAHRGQGCCRTLMTQIHTLLADRGYCGSLLVPGDADLRQMYRAMGYENFGGIREFTCRSAPPAAPLRQLTEAGFAASRRKYLPENGVIQEGATLQLLSKVADFYAGTDFVAAISREEQSILELLGNTDAPAGIAYALNLPQVSVRAPGASPFAMYRALRGDKIPGYFGFALD